MDVNVDPRIWNLFVGAVVAAGCGARTAGEAGETGPECTSSADCPAGYGCYDGACMYYQHHDGWTPYYECYADAECDDFEICEFGYCSEAEVPPPFCETAEAAIPVPVDEPALALTFADVDADGQDELVIATATGLVVHEQDGSPPVVTSVELTGINSMAAGEFDAVPGEDLVALLGIADVRSFASTGDGSFGPAVATAPALDFVVGMIAGELDDVPPTDLLWWGPDGAYVERGGEVTVFEAAPVDAAALFEFGAMSPGYFVVREGGLGFYDLDGQENASAAGVEGPPAIAAFRSVGGPAIATIVQYENWSRVEVRDPSDAQVFGDWVIPGTPSQLLAGDLDGDGDDELVFNASAGMSIEYNPIGPGDCWDVPMVGIDGISRGAAFGDHDGDGDDELAIISSLGAVALFDGG